MERRTPLPARGQPRVAPSAGTTPMSKPSSLAPASSAWRLRPTSTGCSASAVPAPSTRPVLPAWKISPAPSACLHSALLATPSVITPFAGPPDTLTSSAKPPKGPPATTAGDPLTNWAQTPMAGGTAPTECVSHAPRRANDPCPSDAHTAASLPPGRTTCPTSPSLLHGAPTTWPPTHRFTHPPSMLTLGETHRTGPSTPASPSPRTAPPATPPSPKQAPTFHDATASSVGAVITSASSVRPKSRTPTTP